MPTKTRDSDTAARPRRFVRPRAEEIVEATLAACQGRDLKSPESRMALLGQVKSALAEARAGAEADLRARGKGLKCAENLAAAEDEIIRAVYLFATRHVYAADNPSEAEAVAIAAVGGYGRGTLAPGSDIDLLFVLPYKQTPWGEQVTEFMLYLLWDLGQKVGHAVRSVDDCIRMARADMTVRTATLEARFLIGDARLFDTLMDRFENEIVAKTGPEFIAAKMAEREERHAREGNTRYLVEPNIKEGKGGLRDLNTLFWIGKYFYRVKSPAELVDKGVFSTAEYAQFVKAEDFLWAVRCHMHFYTRRADEKLTFDLQPALAEAMGYHSRAGMLAVERFMKRYFLVAKTVGDLTRIFSTSLEFAHAKKPEGIARVLPGFRAGQKKLKGEEDFVVDSGRLNIAHGAVFTDNPVNLVRIFWVAGKQGLRFHPDALKEITRSLRLINPDLRANPEANRYFLEILTAPETVEWILRRMNEAGVLGRFVPEFGKIVALMQFNMYHHYTVDEHLIRAVGVMAKIANGGLKDELPLTHELLPTLNDTRLIYVALFLHDIAKGRPEDHSSAGARLARRFCPRLGLNAAETDTVAWLVEHHLLMSEIAQARDIQDPTTARSFAEIVQSPNRLAMLMILTACDIRAVGPGVWTGWKGSLLRALYYATEPILSGGHSQVSQKNRVEEAKDALQKALPNWSKSQFDAYADRHYSPYWLRAEPEVQIEHARMIAAADKAGRPFAGATRVKSFEQMTEVSFYTPDHPRLLSLIAGACTMCDASIMNAQIFNMRDGRALDTFSLRRAFSIDEDERLRAARIIETVKQILQGTLHIPRDLGHDSRLNKRLKPFSVPAEVQVTNALSARHTVIEASGLDRTGLLYDLTRAISDLNLTIASAHISTFGEKAVDVFYVTDLTGDQIESKARQKRIRDRLTAVFEPPKPQKAAEAK